MLRKRYTVVVVGEGGMALAQRSEVSRHRSEREARAAADEARGRLAVMHGDRAGSYRVIVERDGEPVQDAEGLGPRPAILDLDLERDAPSPAAPEEGVRVIRREPASGGDDEPAPPLFPDLDQAGDEDLERLLEDGAPAPPRERPRMRLPAFDEIPSGRVPDEVLRRFEEAIAREERRRSQRPPAGRD